MGRILMVILLSSVLGCGATREVSVRSYKQDKKRIDQTVGGPVGNWENAPQAVSTQKKDTRKVYFLEFSKEPPAEPNFGYLVNEEKKEVVDEDDSEKVSSRKSSNNFSDESDDEAEEESSPKARKINLPSFDEDSDEYTNEREVRSVSDDQRFEDYTITTNDTLQKISMKFYNSYSKWPRIYEANKDVLKSPDILKPGTNLKIPVD